MKRSVLHIAFLFLLLLNSGSVMAFTGVYIPDPNFRNFLLTNHPSVLYADQSLNTTAAAALNTPFKCYTQNITDLTGIQYFTNITTLEVKYNPNLLMIPDISGLTQINTLGLDSNALTSLPNLSTLTNLQVLSFHHNQVSVLPSVSNLTQLRILFANKNQLTVLPSLSALVNLDKLNVSDNPLTAYPSFNTLIKLTFFACTRVPVAVIPSLNNCTLLNTLVCNSTPIASLPNISNCTLLSEIWSPDCQLTTLPNLTAFPSLTTVNFDNNQLSFEDLLPSSSHANFASFTFAGQNPGTAFTQDANDFSNATLSLGFDNTVSSNVYQWYKNGVLLPTTTTVNQLSFSPVHFSDEGVYTSTITNTTPALSGITLNSKAITLRISPCILSNNLAYTIENTSCTYPILVAVDESSFTAGTPPYSYQVADTKDTLSFNSSQLALKKEGTFDLLVTDATGCEVTFTSKLVVPRNEQCDPVFYPNGDGVADTYYIQGSGQAQIFDRSGELIKELTVPANWDGTNKKGQEAPSGLYVIVVNKDTTINVTLLR